MINFRFNPKTYAPVEIIRERISDTDRTELFFSGAEIGKSPRQILRMAVDMSDFWCSVEIENETVGVFGLVEFDQWIALPWAYFTDDLREYPMTLYRKAREIVEIWNEQYPILYGRVLRENFRAIQFIERLGFELSTDTPSWVPLVTFMRTRGEPCVIQ